MTTPEDFGKVFDHVEKLEQAGKTASAIAALNKLQKQIQQVSEPSDDLLRILAFSCQKNLSLSPMKAPEALDLYLAHLSALKKLKKPTQDDLAQQKFSLLGLSKTYKVLAQSAKNLNSSLAQYENLLKFFEYTRKYLKQEIPSLEKKQSEFTTKNNRPSRTIRKNLIGKKKKLIDINMAYLSLLQQYAKILRESTIHENNKSIRLEEKHKKQFGVYSKPLTQEDFDASIAKEDEIAHLVKEVAKLIKDNKLSLAKGKAKLALALSKRHLGALKEDNAKTRKSLRSSRLRDGRKKRPNVTDENKKNGEHPLSP